MASDLKLLRYSSYLNFEMNSVHGITPYTLIISDQVLLISFISNHVDCNVNIEALASLTLRDIRVLNLPPSCACKHACLQVPIEAKVDIQIGWLMG